MWPATNNVWDFSSLLISEKNMLVSGTQLAKSWFFDTSTSYTKIGGKFPEFCFDLENSKK